MLCVENTSEDIFFNLSAEEHLLKRSSEEFCMLWVSRPSIVVGKHQNAFAEVNLEFVRNHHILMARRLTGGGTVYHDTGNLNFTFIRNGTEGTLINFQEHTMLIRMALSSMGLNTRIKGQHSLTLHGLKISGNAEHVFKKRVLHHGTLLFSSNLDHLVHALTVEEGKYQHKGVPSIPSPVTNISSHLKSPLSIEEFKVKIQDFVLQHEPGSRLYQFTPPDLESIRTLRDNKYATNSWIFGYGPKYALHHIKETTSGPIEVHLEVDKGHIKNIQLKSEWIRPELLRKIEQKCLDAPHDPDTIDAALIQVSQLHSGPELKGLLFAFF